MVSQLEWTGDILVNATVRAVFGEAIFKFKPDIVADFFRWDETAWKMHANCPKFAARGMYAAKDRALSALADYMRLPASQRSDALCMIGQTEQRLVDAGVMEPSQRASFFLAIHRVINGNAYRHTLSGAYPTSYTTWTFWPS